MRRDRSASSTGTKCRSAHGTLRRRNRSARVRKPAFTRGPYTVVVARTSSPARLVIALSVAGVLAIFLLYTSLAGGGTPSVSPSELATKTGEVSLAGRVVGAPTGDPHGAGMRFVLEDFEGAHKQRVTVLYK